MNTVKLLIEVCKFFIDNNVPCCSHGSIDIPESQFGMEEHLERNLTPSELDILRLSRREKPESYPGILIPEKFESIHNCIWLWPPPTCRYLSWEELKEELECYYITLQLNEA